MQNFNCIFYYALHWRSALALLTGNNTELLNTSQLIGKYNKWLGLEGSIEEIL